MATWRPPISHTDNMSPNANIAIRNETTTKITVFLNHRISVTCGLRGNVPRIKIDGEKLQTAQNLLELHINVNRTIQLFTISFIADARLDETTIRCKRLVGRRSKTITFRIQGPPDPVANLTANYNSSAVTVSWKAPISLNVTGVEPDIWYSVIIYNVTNENNQTSIDCTDCINITDTQYILTPRFCNVYNVSVVSLNGAGQGNISKAVTIGDCEEIKSTNNVMELIIKYVGSLSAALLLVIILVLAVVLIIKRRNIQCNSSKLQEQKNLEKSQSIQGNEASAEMVVKTDSCDSVSTEKNIETSSSSNSSELVNSHSGRLGKLDEEH